MGINSNFESVGPSSIPGQQNEGTSTVNPLSQSTVTRSQQEAVMALYVMGTPSLIQPNSQGSGNTTNVDSISKMVASEFAKIGSDMWDKYNTYLMEEKKRINTELHSPQHLAWVEQQQLPQIRNAVPTPTEYSEWVNGLPPAQRENEILRNHASNVWAQQIDGISNYVNNVHDSNPQAAAFMVASFAITAAFIGTYMNIVDVASTNMVGVNPIQDAANVLMQFVPNHIQDSINMTINLFAVGAIYSSTVNLLPKISGNESEDEMDFEQAKAYAKEIVDKVDSNEINHTLMALLINSSDAGEPLTNQKLNEMAVIVKLSMLSTAIAVLYKVEAGWITGDDFRALVNGDLQPRSDEEADVVSMFQQLRESKVLPSQQWDSVIGALAGYFNTNPEVENILNPARVYANAVAIVSAGEAKG